MNKKILYFAILVFFLIVANQIFPWWSIFAVPFFIAGAKNELSAKSIIWISALAGFIVWASLAYYLGSQNDFMMADKIGILFGDVSAKLLVFITGIIAALYASLGGYLGKLIYLKFLNKKVTSQMS